MLKISTRIALFLGAALLAGSEPSTLADKVPPRRAPPPARMASGATSPSGEKHPGEIIFDDKIENRTYTRNAAEVVASSAWVKVGDTWKAVVRIQITGTPERRQFTKYGADGKVLESHEIVPQPPRPYPLPPT